MIPFSLEFQPGVPIFEQVVFAAKKAIVSGRMLPGSPFPSVRALSKGLKINPNTAHKVVSTLTAEGLLEVHPGIGTIVARPESATAAELRRVLEDEVERLVVEASKMGLTMEQVIEAVTLQWGRLRAEQDEREVDQ